MESSSSKSRILLRQEVLCPLCFFGALFLSRAFVLLRLALAAAASAVPTGSTASSEHEHTRPAPSSRSPSFLSAGWTASLLVAPALACSNLALWLPALAAPTFRGYTTGAPTTPRRMMPHATGGADPVPRRTADAVERRGGRGDGLGCA
jgi:hypothetical protein